MTKTTQRSKNNVLTPQRPAFVGGKRIVKKQVGNEMNEPVQLISVTRAHLQQMMQWFPSHESCCMWGGPEFRFPFTEETFLADSRIEDLPSYSLIGEAGALCGFGQFYLRAGRCHLSRLVIGPPFGNRGLGTRLISMLLYEGRRTLGVSQCSLFVSFTNTSAMALYERLGFKELPCPEEGLEVPGCYYMVSS